MRVHPAHATTEDFQRRASEIRADIDHTLRQLEEQLQADRVWHTVATQLRVSGIALGLAAGRTMLRHPKPLAAVGAALLLYSLATRRRRSRPHRKASTTNKAHAAARVARGVMEAARLVNQLRRSVL